MANKNAYQAYLRAKIAGAITEARAISSLGHQGVKGQIVEVLVSSLFRPLLPSDIGVGTGLILQQNGGRLSGQIDVVLYDRSILPPALHDEKIGVFPVESVLYAIEVKTTLNNHGLKQAHNSAKELGSFSYLPGFFDINGAPVPSPVCCLNNVVFALGSTLKGNGMSEADRYKTVYEEIGGGAVLKAICIAGSSYWYTDERASRWMSVSGVDPFDEVLYFVGGVINTYQRIRQFRGRPLLGHYIIPDLAQIAGPSYRGG